MITVISATNRPDNHTVRFAQKYLELLKKRGVESQLFNLEELPDSFGLKSIYSYHHPELQLLIDKYLIPADKLVVVVPEYNGGIPGVFKVFIDAVKPELFQSKKVALVGISSGRSGNLRGLDQLTNIFNYLNSEVFSYKVPVSNVLTLFSDNGTINDEVTIKALDFQIEKFLKYCNN